jgi:hypothetical protein
MDLLFYTLAFQVSLFIFLISAVRLYILDIKGPALMIGLGAGCSLVFQLAQYIFPATKVIIYPGEPFVEMPLSFWQLGSYYSDFVSFPLISIGVLWLIRYIKA